MSNPHFTPQAELLWKTIPAEARDRILKAVFCVGCCTSVEITKYKATVDERGDVVLRGSCKVCGHSVCRVVETSEAEVPPN